MVLAMMTGIMSKRSGPSLRIEASCMGCVFERSDSYVIQGDSGHDVWCTHDTTERNVGDTTWKTPPWCPLLSVAIENLVSGLK